MKKENNVRFIVKKEIVSGTQVTGRLASYQLAMISSNECDAPHVLSLEDLKKISAFLTAYVEKEEKEEGGAR